jgi:hypothetical protein
MSAPKITPLLEEMIDRAVMGKPSPWETDPAFPPKGTFEERFNAGDKQILLWEIMYSARRGKPAPEWAAKALKDIMYRMAAGEFKTWDEPFGRIFAKFRRPKKIRGRALMFVVHERVMELKKAGEKIDNALFGRIGKELKEKFDIGTVGSATTIKNLYREAKPSIKRKSAAKA